MAAQQRQSALAEKAAVARALIDEFLRIIDLHRVEFTPATPPVVPAPAQPDRAAIYKHYEQKALAGLSRFNRRGRMEARQRAGAWADGEVRRQLVEASQGHAQAQAYFDERWRQLCDNVPDVVIETLDEAFEDNEAPSAAIGVDGSEVALVVLVPDVDGAIPERMPTTTQAGNLSLKKLTQREREDYYKLYVCGQALVTVREALAVAPGLRSARVALLRSEGPDAYGRPTISCIMAAKLERAALEGVQWATAVAAQIINDVSTDLVHNPRGRSQGLSPIDLAGEPELAQLVQAVDLDELTATDLDEAEPTPDPHGQSSGVGGGAAAPPSWGQAGPASVPKPPGRPKRTLVIALLAGVGMLLVLCCGMGAVLAALGDNKDKVPASPTRSSITTAPSPSTPASVLPVATSSTTTASQTASAPPQPAPPPATTAAPPPPPPPPAPPPTQTGVHPGAFCSPHWAYGYTSNGVLMQCKPSAAEPTTFRWRQA